MNQAQTASSDPVQVLAGQLARRREAADRLPPLDDGRRDPLLEALASMRP